ncbi:MAG: signal peptide peptidase SppA [bacterium]
MDGKKVFMYILAGLFTASIIVGIILIFQFAPEGKTKAPAKVDFSLKQEGVAVVYVYGPISVSQKESAVSIWSYGSDAVVERLKRVRKDNRVKAVVLRVNSPGGTVAAVQEIHQEVQKLKAAGKKVVVSMGDVAASGGYYVACVADKIVANPGTITGSIGVIASLGNVEELFKKIGVKIEVIKSGKHKDIGSVSRPMTAQERTILQDLINNAYEQFVDAIVTGRNMAYDDVKKLADGSIYTGQQAQANGLIDELGNLEEAIKIAGNLAGIQGEPAVISDYYKPFEKFFNMFSQQFDKSPVSRILDKQGMRLEYILE